MADDEHCLFVAADAFECVGNVGKSVGVKGNVDNRSFNATRIELGGSCRGTGLSRRNFYGRTGFSDWSCGGAGDCVGRACRELICRRARKLFLLYLAAGTLADGRADWGCGGVVAAGCQERGRKN